MAIICGVGHFLEGQYFVGLDVFRRVIILGVGGFRRTIPGSGKLAVFENENTDCQIWNVKKRLKIAGYVFLAKTYQKTIFPAKYIIRWSE